MPALAMGCLAGRMSGRWGLWSGVCVCLRLCLAGPPARLIVPPGCRVVGHRQRLLWLVAALPGPEGHHSPHVAAGGPLGQGRGPEASGPPGGPPSRLQGLLREMRPGATATSSPMATSSPTSPEAQHLASSQGLDRPLPGGLEGLEGAQVARGQGHLEGQYHDLARSTGRPRRGPPGRSSWDAPEAASQNV